MADTQPAMVVLEEEGRQLLSPDRAHLFAVALHLAIEKGDASLLEQFKQELIELWNGDGI